MAAAKPGQRSSRGRQARRKPEGKAHARHVQAEVRMPWAQAQAQAPVQARAQAQAQLHCVAGTGASRSCAVVLVPGEEPGHS